jgi:type I restriction enzyme S subunit
MTATSASTQRAFSVWWKDLERWQIPPRTFLHRTLPTGWTSVRIERIVRQVTARVKAQPDTEYKMAGVKWYGEGVFHRETVRGDGMSASQVTPLVPGALIYNRLFAWKVSFAVVTAEFADCYVSNEFPQFIPDTTRVLAEYLYLFCTRDATIQAVNAASTGSAAISRNRFKEEQFLSFEVPLPPLAEQRAIVASWRKAQDEVAAARKRVETQIATIDARFYTDLGLQSPKQLATPRAFAVLWEDFRRWGVGFNFMTQTGADLSLGKYPVAELGSLLELVQYGTSEKANTTGDGIAVIRMNNVVDGQLNLANLKHLRLPRAEVDKLALKDGDILFNRTNSKELVGKCAVFHAKEEFVFASYLIRIRANSAMTDPDFLAFTINSAIGRQQINALSRQIIGQANVNTEELRGLQIPLPPLAMQRQIMQSVVNGRAEIDREREVAERSSKTIDSEIEALILGTKSVKDATGE